MLSFPTSNHSHSSSSDASFQSLLLEKDKLACPQTADELSMSFYNQSRSKTQLDKKQPKSLATLESRLAPSDTLQKVRDSLFDHNPIIPHSNGVSDSTVESQHPFNTQSQSNDNKKKKPKAKEREQEFYQTQTHQPRDQIVNKIASSVSLYQPAKKQAKKKKKQPIHNNPYMNQNQDRQLEYLLSQKPNNITAVSSPHSAKSLQKTQQNFYFQNGTKSPGSPTSSSGISQRSAQNYHSGCNTKLIKLLQSPYRQRIQNKVEKNQTPTPQKNLLDYQQLYLQKQLDKFKEIQLNYLMQQEQKIKKDLSKEKKVNAKKDPLMQAVLQKNQFKLEDYLKNIKKQKFY